MTEHAAAPAGQFWKTPFVWEPGCPLPPPPTGDLRFEPAPPAWLLDAVAATMADSLDESDRHAVATDGAHAAAAALLEMDPVYFVQPAGWWLAAADTRGTPVGFVLPVLFADPARSRGGRPQATIYYMGVLPPHRGRGHALALLHQVLRMAGQADCWRVFCDASSANPPMLRAFRRAGFIERAPWLRPLA